MTPMIRPSGEQTAAPLICRVANSSAARLSGMSRGTQKTFGSMTSPTVRIVHLDDLGSKHHACQTAPHHGTGEPRSMGLTYLLRERHWALGSIGHNIETAPPSA